MTRRVVEVKYSDDLGNNTTKELPLNPVSTTAGIEMFVKNEFPNDHENVDLILQSEDGKEVSLSITFFIFLTTQRSNCK